MPRFHVQRSIDIKADPQVVYAAAVNFDTWTTWSPWLCADADAQVEVSKPSSSVGAVYSWQGEVVGQGEIEHQKDAERVD